MSVPAREMAQRLGASASDSGDLDAVSRRSFVKLLGASLALAGVEGCTRMPAANILPYVNQPELTPGIPQYYATSMVIDGYATGLLVESHDGRPTKVEGNPNHPASLGAAGVLEQASVLQLYDPHRARRIRRGQQTATWNELAAAFAPGALSGKVGSAGAGVFLLLEPSSSPLQADLLNRLRERYPSASVHYYAPLVVGNEAVVPQYDLRHADVLLSVDADVLASGPFHLRYTREFAARRRPEAGPMNRLYAIESSVTVTGNAADHRLAVPPSGIEPVLEQLLQAIGGDATAGESPYRRWIAALASDLRSHAGRSVAIASPYLPPRTRALVYRINDTLQNVGRTIWFTQSALAGAGDRSQSLGTLVDALQAGQVHTLVCAGGNPVYASPYGRDFGALMQRVPETIYLGLYENETARHAGWMVPSAHYLESWGDARAYDGTLSVVQPLVEPIFGGRTLVELLSVLIGEGEVRPYDLLRQSWRERTGQSSDVDSPWHNVLRAGLLPNSSFPREQRSPALDASDLVPATSPPVELVFRPHPRVRDGAFANNAWLQELPDPITTLTWDNAAQMSADTAAALDLRTGDLVDVTVDRHTVRLPAFVVSGHADQTITLSFGYGRSGAEAVARGAGTDVYPLWPGDRFVVSGATITRAAGSPRQDLAVTQPHRTLDTATPARILTLEEFTSARSQPRPKTLTLYEPRTSLPDGPAPQQWGMTIDLGACIGCGACMVACQAENNVPVVGRDDVLRGREMHWLRIDWYAPASGDAPAGKPASADAPAGESAPLAIAQPMLCQHCEKAPCEYVCPVEATVHSRDGLNEMIYNRCVGTRFCSNNCPYKVRRFNWIDYNADLSDSERLVKNPDVTVRERGVMEKCTLCVQRIRQHEIEARVEHREFTGRDIQTACQQACPAQAITFGSLTDRSSAVVAARQTTRAYAVLEQLGTQPRVLYLARVRNTNPDLEPST